MGEHAGVVLLLGRIIDLLRRTPDASDDQRAALRELTELVSTRSLAIRLDGSHLTVEGDSIAEATPFAALLVQQMDVHALTEIRLAHAAPPVDILELAKGIALDLDHYPPGHDLPKRLADEGVTGVSVVTREQAERARGRRGVRVTQAVTPPKGPVEGMVPAARGAAYQEMERQGRPSGPPTIAATVRALRGADANRIARQLESVHDAITKAFDEHEMERALVAIVALVDEETASVDEATRRAFGISIRRVLSNNVLDELAKHLLDEVYRTEITQVMRRAGASGTKVLLDRLVEAPSYAERLSYLKALRLIEEGREAVTSLLRHREWYVVRNAADLVGELRIEQAAQELGKVADHGDPRVRRSVGIALARIGTASTAQYLARIMRDPDKDVRLAVLREIGGRGVAALSMPVLNAMQGEQDPDIVEESFRVLGRIGTPDAVQALMAAALDRGGLLSRRPLRPRLAAIDGLALAGTAAAKETLQQLREDRTREVREAAEKALKFPVG